MRALESREKGSDKLNPYIVLGCSANDNFETIRKKYIKLSKEHHPDVLINKGVPPEVIEESKKKMRAINAAYDQIEKNEILKSGPKKWWPGTESNRRHKPFQGSALPTELPGLIKI